MSAVAGTIVSLVLMMIVVSLFLALFRLIRGPTLPDRVVALDLIAILAIGIMAVYAIATRQPVYIDAAIIIALINFLATVGFARYLEIRTFHGGPPRRD